MTKKHRKRLFKALKIVLLVLVVLVIALAVSLAVVADLGPNDFRSLVTIKKVDDYPLYVMRYYGDYGFKDLQTGRGLKGVWKWAYEELKPQGNGSMCTCFTTSNQQADRVFGRNFDWWNTKAALLLFTEPPDRYASVSIVDITYFDFNPEDPGILDYLVLVGAPYMPFDGMNECGLAVGIMSIEYSDGGSDPNKETLGVIQLMRQMLDNASNVDEAIMLARKYNIVFYYGPTVHLLISDADGNSAVVEFLDGGPVITRNEHPFQACTNFIVSGKNTEQALDSCWRYKTAYNTLQQADGELSPQQAMTLLSNVSEGHTVWSAVYGQSTGKIQLAMGKGYERICEFSLEMKDKEGTKTNIYPIRPAQKADE